LYADPTDDNKLEKLDTVTALQYYVSHGFPAKKINIGGALYGRGFTGTAKTNNGLHQKFSGVPKGTWDDG
jgi:chitinase